MSPEVKYSAKFPFNVKKTGFNIILFVIRQNSPGLNNPHKRLPSEELRQNSPDKKQPLQISPDKIALKY